MSQKIKTPLLIRVFHWCVALVVLINEFILEAGDPPHRYLGYFCVCIVTLRLFVGEKLGTTCKYSLRNFSLHPKTLMHFLTQMLRGQHLDYEGHNPLASYVYLGIWLCIFNLGFTGWLMGWDRFWGNSTLETIHLITANLILALVGLHLLGILTDAYFHKRQTWLRMITGKKN